MKKASKEHRKVIILFIAILLIQVFTIVYAASKREYCHIDELYSQGLMQYKRAFIFDNEDFLNQWHEKAYFEDYLVINENEKWDFSAVYTNQIEDVHPPIYYLFLRIASMFQTETFSIWPGTILNILLYILSTIVLYKIGRKLFKSPYTALLVCFINGCSIATIETVMYIRMYQFVILHVLLLLYWHLKYKDKEYLTIKQLIPLGLMVVFGFLTHYYYAIIAVVLWGMFMIHYRKKKQMHNALVYTLTMLVATIVSFSIFPYAISHIFFGYRGQEVMQNIFQLSHLTKYLTQNIKIIQQELFNNNLNILLKGIIVLCGACLTYMIAQNKKKKDMSNRQPETNTNYKYIVIPMLLYLFIITIASPYQDLRYIMPVIPLIFVSLVYLIQNILQMMLSKKTTFIILLVISFAFFTTLIRRLDNNIYTYNKYAEVFARIESEYANIPWIYVYEPVPVNANKTMECYGALIRVEQTYIMELKELKASRIKEVIQSKDTSQGVMLLLHIQNQEQVIDTVMATGNFTENRAICTLGRYIMFYFK